MVLTKELQSPPFVRLHGSHSQNDRCQTAGMSVRGTEQCVEASNVLLRDVCLTHEPDDLVLTLKHIALGPRHLRAFAADVDLVPAP